MKNYDTLKIFLWKFFWLCTFKREVTIKGKRKKIPFNIKIILLSNLIKGLLVQRNQMHR